MKLFKMKTCFYCLSIFAALFYILSFTGCRERSTEANELIPVKPVVKVSNTNYSQDSFNKSFPDNASLKNIGSAYSGSKYSEEVKKALNDYIRRQASKLGEDSKTFDRIISLSGSSITGEYVLPTYAEKAKYMGQDVWIFQITTGLGAPNFEHYKCFVFGLAKFDTLDYVGCK